MLFGRSTCDELRKDSTGLALLRSWTSRKEKSATWDVIRAKKSVEPSNLEMWFRSNVAVWNVWTQPQPIKIKIWFWICGVTWVTWSFSLVESWVTDVAPRRKVLLATAAAFFPSTTSPALQLTALTVVTCFSIFLYGVFHPYRQRFWNWSDAWKQRSYSFNEILKDTLRIFKVLCRYSICIRILFACRYFHSICTNLHFFRASSLEHFKNQRNVQCQRNFDPWNQRNVCPVVPVQCLGPGIGAPDYSAAFNFLGICCDARWGWLKDFFWVLRLRFLDDWQSWRLGSSGARWFDFDFVCVNVDQQTCRCMKRHRTMKQNRKVAHENPSSSSSSRSILFGEQSV